MTEASRFTKNRQELYKATIDVAHGRTVLLSHNTSESMLAALRVAPEGRIFCGRFGNMDSVKTYVSFNDEFSVINSFESMPLALANADELNSVFTDTIEKRGHHIVGGMVRVYEETGEIYRIYDDPQNSERQYQAWSEDVTNSFRQSESGYFQYVTDFDNESRIVGYYDRSKKIHMITKFEQQDSHLADEFIKNFRENTGIPMHFDPPDEIWQEMTDLSQLG